MRQAQNAWEHPEQKRLNKKIELDFYFLFTFYIVYKIICLNFPLNVTHRPYRHFVNI
jgi:hypothetical protein